MHYLIDLKNNCPSFVPVIFKMIHEFHFSYYCYQNQLTENENVKGYLIIYMQQLANTNE